jgi:hypothetical protein
MAPRSSARPHRIDMSRKARRENKRPSATSVQVAAANRPDSLHVLLLPVVLAVVLAALSFVPRVAQVAVLAHSFQGASLVLLLWSAGVFWQISRVHPRLSRSIEVVLRKQHYIQAAVQFSVYAYWGYFWRPVYEHAWLIVAQLIFAYAFDMLLTWSRREKYVLGFGAFPIVFSTNLFLWFKDDWFYLQFLMIAVGILGKEFVRWNRDGKSTHIFNPSAFTLGLFSIVLITTGTSDLTWGQQIASTLTLAPHIYVYLFAVGLIVMYFFSITLIAGTAAAVLFLLSAIYTAATGVPYFLDSEIPAAVFLGLHLLVTDPSTSPRTPLGKAIFGALYGAGVFVLYWLLTSIGAPTFYDKLLCVPLLNLSVKWIDRLANAIATRAPALPRVTSLNPAHMAAWIVLFVTMTAVGKTDGKHTGDSVPFWQQACASERTNACKRLLQLEITYCADNSAWACNELGIHYREGTIVAPDVTRARANFAKACELRLQAGCTNMLRPDQLRHEDPHELDLRLLLREGGRNLMTMSGSDLYARACGHGWDFACERSAGAR